MTPSASDLYSLDQTDCVLLQEKTPSEKKKAKCLVLDMIAVADGHILSSSSILHTFVLPGFNPFNPTVQDEYDKIFAQKKEPSALP